MTIILAHIGTAGQCQHRGATPAAPAAGQHELEHRSRANTRAAAFVPTCVLAAPHRSRPRLQNAQRPSWPPHGDSTGALVDVLALKLSAEVD